MTGTWSAGLALSAGLIAIGGAAAFTIRNAADWNRLLPEEKLESYVRTYLRYAQDVSEENREVMDEAFVKYLTAYAAAVDGDERKAAESLFLRDAEDVFDFIPLGEGGETPLTSIIDTAQGIFKSYRQAYPAPAALERFVDVVGSQRDFLQWPEQLAAINGKTRKVEELCAR